MSSKGQPLFDHLVRDGNQRRRQLDPERHRGF
jgi:hypothetical protein